MTQFKISQTSKSSQEISPSSSQISLIAEKFAEFVADPNKNSQEFFGSDYENLDPRSSQQSKSSKNNSQASQKLDPLIGIDEPLACLLKPSSNNSLPDSQKTNYFEHHDEKLAILTLTPEASQEDDQDLFNDDDSDEQMENDDLENSNSEILNRNQNQVNSISPVLNKARHPYVKQMNVMIENERKNGRHPQSKGKSDKAIDRLKEHNQLHGDSFNSLNGYQQVSSEGMQVDQYSNRLSKSVYDNQSYNSSYQSCKGKFGKMIYENSGCSQSMLTDLDDYQDRNFRDGKSNSSYSSYNNNISEYYDASSNLSRSSTSASYQTTAEDFYNEESSNDSMVRKRKKKLKFTELKHKVAKNHDEDMKTLSHQLKEASITTPKSKTTSAKDAASLEFFEKSNQYWGSNTPSKIRSTENSIQNLSTDLETPQKLGSIPKSSKKKSCRKIKTDNLVKTPLRKLPASSDTKKAQSRVLSFKKRTTSTSSNISMEEDEFVDKKARRRSKNAESAKKYREKKKEEEKELDDKLEALKMRFDELRSDLAVIFSHKRGLITLIAGTKDAGTLPEWSKLTNIN